MSLGVHVADEASNDFLPLYNALIESLRDRYAWLPFPTFSYPVWLGGLIVLVLALLAMTPLVLHGYRWLRRLSYFLGILMIANAIGHLLASIWLRDFVAGVYSSPLLLVAAIALLVTAARSGRAELRRTP